jgi:hypothetical protein
VDAARPSVVLHGFGGGIVSNSNIGLRLAQIILESVIGPQRVALCLPLRAQDRDDRWTTTSDNASDLRNCRIDLRKLDAAVVSLSVDGTPEALPRAEAVEKLAAAIVENSRGSAELSRQLPFAITDKGDTWLVQGSDNAARAAEDPGPFHLEVQKRDARVLDMWFEWVLPTPPEVKELIRQSMRKPRGSL